MNTEKNLRTLTLTLSQRERELRRGISLLEVLFSIFVLSVGLLSLASMVPVGMHQVTEATHADRGAACGKAAINEFQVRGMGELDALAVRSGNAYPDIWQPSTSYTLNTKREPITRNGFHYRVTAAGTSGAAEPPWSTVVGTPTTDGGVGGVTWTCLAPVPFMLDPLSVRTNDVFGTNGLDDDSDGSTDEADESGKNGLDDDGDGSTDEADEIVMYDHFPYRITGFPRMERLTLRRETAPDVYAPLRRPMCERIFSWTDDRIFETPTDEAARPRHLVDSTGAALPAWQQSKGDYTWMAMVTPLGAGLARVSIVVFHKRELAYDSAAVARSERSVYCEMPAGFGGDMVLRDTTSATLQQAEEFLKVRPYQWILMAGQLLPASSSLPVYKWYRVVTTSQVTGTANDWYMDVTLAGPDLDPTIFVDQYTASGTDTTMYAIICDGVIGVYEKTVQLE